MPESGRKPGLGPGTGNNAAGLSPDFFQDVKVILGQKRPVSPVAVQLADLPGGLLHESMSRIVRRFLAFLAPPAALTSALIIVAGLAPDFPRAIQLVEPGVLAEVLNAIFPERTAITVPALVHELEVTERGPSASGLLDGRAE